MNAATVCAHVYGSVIYIADVLFDKVSLQLMYTAPGEDSTKQVTQCLFDLGILSIPLPFSVTYMCLLCLLLRPSLG